MAVLTMQGQKVPVAVNLRIDAGPQPSASIIVANGSREFIVNLDHGELMKMVAGLWADPRFHIDTSKWTRKDREAYEAQLDAFMREQGL